MEIASRSQALRMLGIACVMALRVYMKYRLKNLNGKLRRPSWLGKQIRKVKRKPLVLIWSIAAIFPHILAFLQVYRET